MKEPFIFYRALDPLKGSWDGYGYFAIGEKDFFAYVTDAPSNASVHTPEIIQNFWSNHIRSFSSANGTGQLAKIELADAVNRLQDELQRRSRQDGSLYQATMSLARKSGNLLLYCAIGDSALQVLRREKLYRLSSNELWDGSLIMEEERPLKERQKTGTLQTVGSGGQFIHAGQIFYIDLQPDDLVLLSTDGLEDLLPPNRLIGLLKKKTPESLRNELEKIFIHERLKDDVTFLAVGIDVPKSLDPFEEVKRLETEITQLKSDQSQFQNHIQRAQVSSERLDKIERNLSVINQQLGKIGRSMESRKKDIEYSQAALRNSPQIQSSQLRRIRGVSPWWFILGAFLLGLLAGLLLFWWGGQKPAGRATSRTPFPAPRLQTMLPAPNKLPQNECRYVVIKGDSLEKIAARNKIAIEDLLLLNPSIRRSVPLKIGDQITICREGL